MTDPVDSVLRRAELDAKLGVHLAAAASMGAALSAAEGGGWGSRREEVLSRCRAIGGLLDVETVLADSHQALERIGRVVSVGNRFNDDEWMLLLTLRVQVALANVALSTVAGIAPLFREDVHDARLVELARHPVNRTAHRSAVADIQRYWRSRVPFDTDRLGLGQLVR